jgi:hypothetical protein
MCQHLLLPLLAHLHLPLLLLQSRLALAQL